MNVYVFSLFWWPTTVTRTALAAIHVNSCACYFAGTYCTRIETCHLTGTVCIRGGVRGRVVTAEAMRSRFEYVEPHDTHGRVSRYQVSPLRRTVPLMGDIPQHPVLLFPNKVGYTHNIVSSN